MRRSFFSSVLICAFVLQACALPRINDHRPNFLIVLTDDQRFDTMQYMPNTQQLIFDQGVTFSHGYITTPFCCPSRASILTGMYAHNHGVHVNEDKLAYHTVFQDLHDNGYYTGLVGKYLNSWKGDKRPEFDYWVSFYGGTLPSYYDPNLNINGKWEKKTGYITDFFRDYVIEFLGQASTQHKPWILLFAPNAPHAPFTPFKGDKNLYADLPPFRPPSYNEADLSDKPASIADRALFSAEDSALIDSTRIRQLQTLASLDRAMGAILQKLKDTGELDNTLIIFLSDNGKHWGEHRLDTKSTAYEESVKVPFALRYPPLVPKPYTEDKLVANIDIAPTIYQLSETAIPKTVDGLSLVNLLTHTGSWRSDLLLEAWPDRGHWISIHTDRYVYIETDNELSELYDLTSDPYEMNSVLNDPAYQSVLQDLQAKLAVEKVPRQESP